VSPALSQFGRLTVTLAIVTIGWVIGGGVATGRIAGSGLYAIAAASLLAVGLYSSTYGIDRAELADDRWLVVRAATVGVMLKALLIAGAMLVIWRDPQLAVLGVAVAQVDPLSVTAIGNRRGMTSRARTILTSWASFDDPVTALLTVYISVFAIKASHRSLADLGSIGGSTRDLLVGVALAIGLALTALVIRRVLQRQARAGRSIATIRVAESFALVGFLVLAVAEFVMLFAALLGLILRPAWLKPWITRIATGAYFAAALALGLVLTPSVRAVLVGVALGIAAVLAHVVTALLLTRGLPPQDRAYLALGQQNGITAITLALLLEPYFPDTVAIVAVAVLVVNVLYVINNLSFERIVRRRSRAPKPDLRSDPPLRYAGSSRETPGRRTGPAFAAHRCR